MSPNSVSFTVRKSTPPTLRFSLRAGTPDGPSWPAAVERASLRVPLRAVPPCAALLGDVLLLLLQARLGLDARLDFLIKPGAQLLQFAESVSKSTLASH